MRNIELKSEDIPFNETKQFDLEVKNIDEEQRIFEGYASVFGNTDAYNDIVQKGAFKKTIQERGNKIKILWQHDMHTPIGKLLDAEEDDIGLKITAKISETDKGDEALQLMKDGVVDELSIGYDVIKKEYDEDGRRLLKEIKLYEVSPVTFAANPLAEVTGVKAVPSYKDLPLADRNREWDSDQAVEKLKEYAGGPDKEEINWVDYQKGFMYYDADNPDLYTSYKLPYADVIDGELYAVPRAIFTIAAVLEGAMGGVDILQDAQEDVEDHIERYYAKMREQFDDEDLIAPWNKSKSSDLYKYLYDQYKSDENYNIEKEEVEEEVKEGRTISEANYVKLKNALELLQEVLDTEPRKSTQQDKFEANSGNKESGNHSDDNKSDDNELENKLDEILDLTKDLIK